MHNMYEAYKHMYQAIGVKDVNLILPPPQPPVPTDPATENIMAMSGKPFQAFPGQDHRAHIDTHHAFMGTNMARNNPMVLAALVKNIFEHIALMAQEQVELEFREELVKREKLMREEAKNQKIQSKYSLSKKPMHELYNDIDYEKKTPVSGMGGHGGPVDAMRRGAKK